MKQNRKKWAYLYMPLFFLIFGYGIIYVTFAPVIQFVSSAINLILLTDGPVFDEKSYNYLESKDLPEIKKAEKIAGSEIVYPSVGDIYGSVNIDKLKIKVDLTFGDREQDLRKSAGQYNGAAFPGETGTTLIAGHNTAEFGTLNLLEKGDKIKIKTHYGDYTYAVTGSKVANAEDESAIAHLFDKKGNKLILYTCYPMDMVGLTPDRYFVYADLVDGTLIDEDK